MARRARRVRPVRVVRFELNRNELCAIMLIIDHGLRRSKRSELVVRDLKSARARVARALVRACEGG